ncbi:prepilin peptidase [Methylocucumis oryzae]|uniref:prepilin peptidase n=1 Tax=Methylocucumis oryzae TaxID=1632867 RepID=UPI000A8FAE23
MLWLGLVVNLGGYFTDIDSAVLGAVFGYLSLWLVYHAFKLLTGKEGMGFGDFKLLAMLGAWLGWQQLPLIILVSSLVGAIFGIAMMVIAKRNQSVPIPFGPYLACAGWIAMLWGRDLTGLYLKVAGF